MTGKRSGEASTGGFVERRRYKRSTTVIRARVLADELCLDGVVLDVSINGVRLKLSEELEVGTAVTLVLAGAVHFGGHVAWRRDRNHGIAFANQPDAVAKIMAGLLPTDYLHCGHA